MGMDPSDFRTIVEAMEKIQSLLQEIKSILLEIKDKGLKRDWGEPWRKAKKK